MSRKKVEFRLEESCLKEWDQFREKKLGGMTRTALIINAVELYKLIIDKEFNKNGNDINMKLQNIDFVLQMLNKKLSLVNQEHNKLEEEIISVDTSEIFNYDSISIKIQKILKTWSGLKLQAIVENINVPAHLVYTVLKKLEAKKKVKVINGVWNIYD